jgi:hypothetical protein
MYLVELLVLSVMGVVNANDINDNMTCLLGHSNHG